MPSTSPRRRCSSPPPWQWRRAGRPDRASESYRQRLTRQTGIEPTNWNRLIVEPAFTCEGVPFVSVTAFHCEAVRSISKNRLVEAWGRVAPSSLVRVEDCLRILMGL